MRVVEQDMAKEDVPAGWAAAHQSLAEAVRRVSRDGPESSARRVAVAAPAGADPLRWLRAQPAPRGFWSSRGEAHRAHAFAGVAERFEDPARLCEHLAARSSSGNGQAVAQRYYGGVCFNPGRPPAEPWRGFGTGAFVRPRFELEQPSEEAFVLAAHLAPGDDAEAVAAQAERLRAPEAAPAAFPQPQHRRDRPPRPGWDEGIASALRAVGEGTLQKVVLARRTTFSFAAPLDPVALLGRLRALAPGGFHFLIQPRRAGAFLGASPERLFRQRGRRVWSEAVAGTRPRAAAAEADAALRDELLQSEKDRREHAFVQRSVRDALRPLCTALEERTAAPLTLRRGRHLYARIEGALRDDVAPAEVLHALHPTPAVGGVPHEAALQFLRQHEPFDRGWYAAPVGWIGLEQGRPAADLAVGIRSGLVREKEGEGRLDLFAGAGIVDGSEAEAEWNEVEQKLANFAAVFE